MALLRVWDRRVLIAKAQPTEWLQGTGISSAWRDFFVEAFETYVATLQAGITEDLVITAAAANNPDALIGQLDWRGAGTTYRDTLEEGLTQIAISATQRELEALVQKQEIVPLFDLDNPFALEWIRTHVFNTVVGIGAETEAAIRLFLEWAFVGGAPPRQLARILRHVIGLNGRWSQTLINLQNRLIAEGVAARDRDRITALRAQKLRDARALTIARTETINANAAGTEGSWMVARDRGLVAPTAVKVWIAAMKQRGASPVPSGRTCKICGELDGQMVPLGQPFQSSYVGAIDRPSAHPNGRCSMGLRTLTKDEFDRVLLTGRL